MKKLLLLAAVFAVLVGFYLSDGQHWLLPQTYQALYLQSPLQTAGIFFAIYVLVTALSIPGAAFMTLIAGAVFGFSQGLLLVSFASSIGATLAFLLSRWLLKDWVQEKFSKYLATINQGVKKDGAFYLFTLRLIPAVPFFAINLLMALTPIPSWRFYWVSQLGMLAGTAVYVNAGVELASVISQGEGFSLAGIMTPGLIGAFILLAIFPWCARIVLNQIQQSLALKKLAKGRRKPKKFDDNLIVIGGGAAGLVSSLIGSAVKAQVSLIEKHQMGGDCLNTGCVPSKALIHAAKVHQQARNGFDIGLLQGEKPRLDFQRVMQHVKDSIKAIEPHDSIERYEGLGVNCITGQAQIISPWEVEIESAQGEKTIRSAANIIIASGGRPRIPDIPGLEQVSYYTSDTLWQINELPQKLLVLGAGPIGCELGQAFARLGSQVTLVDRGRFMMPREDQDVSQLVATSMAQDGIQHIAESGIVSLHQSGQDYQARLSNGEEVNFDVLLLAVGRQANTQSIGLEKVGIETDAQGFIAVDEYLQTSCPTVYACGDVIGGYQFTHVSAHEAWYASVNSLFGRLKRFKANYRVIPWVTFTSPEVARVGLNEKGAKAQGIAYDSTQYDLSDLDRAITDDAAQGFVRVLTVPGKDKIIGATIVGPRADDLIANFVIAMKHNLGLNKVLGTIHAYPTYMEANKFVAGQWKRKQVSARLLAWLAKYHNKKLNLIEKKVS
jgi:pyruvate/2-oxoglutarate dehydrogenase complex dihydrolipoamide dehydrogenase (E3) component/uncharacterized membrane protein YdjX (TVP38/TMEM64 family)